MNDAVIISDIHLGSNVCQAKLLQDFLNNLPETKRLIINGDLFDSWDFRRLKSSHWKILETLRKLSKNIELIWIRGNHDGNAEDVSSLIGSSFVNEYVLTSQNKNILILHGDIFDKFISNYPIFTKLTDYFYRLIQQYDSYFSTEYYYSNWAKRNSKTFLRCSEQICERAKMYGSLKDVDAVICGHTHMSSLNHNGNIDYYNCGSWTEKYGSYINIYDGNIELLYWP